MFSTCLFSNFLLINVLLYKVSFSAALSPSVRGEVFLLKITEECTVKAIFSNFLYLLCMHMKMQVVMNAVSMM